MKISPWCFLLGLGVGLFVLPVRAKGKPWSLPPAAPLATPASEPGPLPAESAPRVNPADPPSVSLQPFVDTHLGTILAPLGTAAFAQPEVVASLKASYADAMAAAPAAHRPAFALAISICDALNGAMAERQNAVVAVRGAVATRSSEAEQPRGGDEAVTKARNRDAFFIDSQKNAWLRRAATLRQGVTTLYLRERTAERQAGGWPPPPPAAVAASTPSVSVPPAAVRESSAQGGDPVIGEWLSERHSCLTLAANHTITGGRTGTWNYLCTTNGGRNYELRWKPPKNWSDYLVLSGDGKMLDGKTRRNDHISYYRP